MSIYNYLKNIGKKAFLTGLALTILGCSSVEPHIKKQFQNESLDKIVKISFDYQNKSKSKALCNKTEYQPMYYDDIPPTYNEFISNLSNLSERQIILTLATLGQFAGQTIYTKKGTIDEFKSNPKVDAEDIYNKIREVMLTGSTKDEYVVCRQIHNFISETAKRAGLQEAITFSCETKEEKHVASAIWLYNKNIKIVDYLNIYEGNSDLELNLRAYQRKKKIPALAHEIYRNEKQLFKLTTVDGKVFYNAIDYPKDTMQLKEILTDDFNEGNPIEVKLGNNENSIKWNDDKLFYKIGYLTGSKDFTWGAPIFQFGSKKIKKRNNNFIFYSMSGLITLIGNRMIGGACGNIVYRKKFDLTPSGNLSIAGQLTSLIDLSAIIQMSTLTNIDDLLALNSGACYTHFFNEKTKNEIYTLIRAELMNSNILTNNLIPVISETKAGCKLTSGNIFINPEYVHRRESDTLSLEAGCNFKNLDLGFKISNAKTLYKRIWPDEKSLDLSIKYTSTNDLSIGGSVKYSQGKWPSDKSYNSKINFWITKNF